VLDPVPTDRVPADPVTTVAVATAGLVLLYLGGEALVRGAGSLAARMRVSPLVIGLTVVAFGTSAPELAVSLEAATSGAGDIALGNVVGSNIANLGLILGVTALVRPATVHARLLRVDAPLMVLASLGLVWMLADGAVSGLEGGILLGGLVCYLVWTAIGARAESDEVRAEFEGGLPAAPSGVLPSLALVVGGVAALVVGGRFLIDAAVEVASAVGVSQAVIGLSLVAVGTSLPEFATSVVAGLRGQGDIAIGNVIGSNLFNILGIVGVTALITPVMRGGVDFLTLGVFVVVTFLVLPLLRTRMKLMRREGALLVAGYAVYLVWLFWTGGAPVA
jgi:cation:H+ antiporter